LRIFVTADIDTRVKRAIAGRRYEGSHESVKEIIAGRDLQELKIS
jgi:cytidylate kinase